MTNDWLCVSLSISVPAIFHVYVDLVTNTSTKTVYNVDNIVGETAATDMMTVFEVEVDATQSSYSQIAVYVSEGIVIRNADIQNQQCHGTSELSLMSAPGYIGGVILHHCIVAIVKSSEVTWAFNPLTVPTSEQRPRPVPSSLCQM